MGVLKKGSTVQGKAIIPTIGRLQPGRGPVATPGSKPIASSAGLDSMNDIAKQVIGALNLK
jgi:hypothetical protein